MFYFNEIFTNRAFHRNDVCYIYCCYVGKCKCFALALSVVCGQPVGVRVAKQRHDEIVGSHLSLHKNKLPYTMYDNFLVETRGFEPLAF